MAPGFHYNPSAALPLRNATLSPILWPAMPALQSLNWTHHPVLHSLCHALLTVTIFPLLLRRVPGLCEAAAGHSRLSFWDCFMSLSKLFTPLLLQIMPCFRSFIPQIVPVGSEASKASGRRSSVVSSFLTLVGCACQQWEKSGRGQWSAVGAFGSLQMMLACLAVM